MTSKRMERLNALCEDKKYDYISAIKLVQTMCDTKMKDESIDIAVKLGVDPRKSDQNVRGAATLPNGLGKHVKIAVFADASQEEALKAAGAMRVGLDDLAEEMKQGKLDYDRIIATPDAMKQVVSKLGQVLGPKGLMPNPKTGSVTNDLVQAVKNAAGGQMVFRTDKAGIIHGSIGRQSFDADKIGENMVYLMKELKRLKPSSSKGVYFVSCHLSSTMSPGLDIDIQSMPI